MKTPVAIPAISESTLARLRGKLRLNETTGCQEFDGYRLPTGHGRFGIGRRVFQAHRVAWIIANGREVPAGMFVCHTCDNPPCCNPGHLFLGTNADNMADCKSKGRQSQGEKLSVIRLRQDQCNRKVTPEIVREIRATHQSRDKSLGYTALAKRFGITRQNVRLIVKGETWGHV